MKKILSSIIYFLFLPISTVATIWILSLYEKFIGFQTAIFRTGDLEGGLIAVAVGVVLFYFFHRVIWQRLEGGSTNFWANHFRLVGAHYLVVIVLGIYLLNWFIHYSAAFKSCQNDCFGPFIIALPVVMSFIAIIVNAIYLKKHNKWSWRSIVDFILDLF